MLKITKQGLIDVWHKDGKLFSTVSIKWAGMHMQTLTIWYYIPR